jgi:hypothetical protein
MDVDKYCELVFEEEYETVNVTLNTIKVMALMAIALPSLSVPAFSATNVSHALDAASIVAAEQCPTGTYFEPDGYVAGGKWRAAHCATGNGHE